VHDATSFRTYLVDHLSVPEDQITTLLDGEATRIKIIGAFLTLCADKRIQNQDPIVIFYAGHGSKIAKPEGWEVNGPHIQALVPQDVKVNDASGQPICPIPDRTIATLLNDLSRAKGDNIVSNNDFILVPSANTPFTRRLSYSTAAIQPAPLAPTRMADLHATFIPTSCHLFR
jgi:hypothetical protein